MSSLRFYVEVRRLQHLNTGKFYVAGQTLKTLAESKQPTYSHVEISERDRVHLYLLNQYVCFYQISGLHDMKHSSFSRQNVNEQVGVNVLNLFNIAQNKKIKKVTRSNANYIRTEQEITLHMQ